MCKFRALLPTEKLFRQKLFRPEQINETSHAYNVTFSNNAILYDGSASELLIRIIIRYDLLKRFGVQDVADDAAATIYARGTRRF